MTRELRTERFSEDRVPWRQSTLRLAMNKIRKGDEVVILLAGKDRGRRGAVLRRVDDEHVVVEGINRVKKHVRPTR